MHVLQTHIGRESRYVTPVADPRLGIKRRFTLAATVPQSGETFGLEVLKDPAREHRLYPNDAGEYELVEWTQIPIGGKTLAPGLRAFMFERRGRVFLVPAVDEAEFLV